MNRTATIAALGAGFALLGALTGSLIGGTAWVVAAAVVAGIAGVAAGAAGMRPLVALAIAVGTIGGALVGRGVVRALCLPGSCPGLEATAAVITGVGALIGVGLVVALVTRSFDEYHEAVAANRPPPTPGCETDGDDQ